MRFCGQTRCCLGPSEKKEQKVIRRKREGERKRERERGDGMEHCESIFMHLHRSEDACS